MKSTYYASSDRALARGCYILDNGIDIKEYRNNEIVAHGLLSLEIPIEYWKYSEEDAYIIQSKGA